MGALVQARNRAANLSRQLGNANGTTWSGAAMNVVAVEAGAFAAGALDAKVPELAGQKPSVAAGVGLAIVGVMTKQPLAVRAAAGMLAPVAYQAGLDAFSK